MPAAVFKKHIFFSCFLSLSWLLAFVSSIAEYLSFYLSFLGTT